MFEKLFLLSVFLLVSCFIYNELNINNTWFLGDMEFLVLNSISYSFAYSWDIELNTRREIPYLGASMYYFVCTSSESIRAKFSLWEDYKGDVSSVRPSLVNIILQLCVVYAKERRGKSLMEVVVRKHICASISPSRNIYTAFSRVTRDNFASATQPVHAT